jgi:tetratricopeptide (TPR) repeat protein
MSVVAETSGPANVEGLRHLRELYFELGKALSRYGRHAEATQAFEQALKEEGPIPDRDVVMFSLGVAYEHAGEPDRAFQNYLQAIAVAPQRMAEVMPCVHKLLTHDLAGKEGEWLDSQWKPKIKTADLPPGLRGDLARFLGRVSLYRSEYTRAEELFRQALAVSPDDPRVLEGLGESLWHNSNISEALEFLTRAHEIAAHGAHRERLMAIDAKLAEVLVSAGQYEAALDRIAESLAEGDRFATELLLSRSQCYLALAQPEKALEAAEAAQQREPASVEARVIRSQALIALGRGSDAVNVIDEALQYDPQRQDLLLYKAQALVEGQIDVRQGRRLLAHYAERAGAEIITPNTLPAALRARSADGNAQYFLAELYRALGYPWLASPRATFKLNSADLPRGMLSEAHREDWKCLARKTICPMWQA